MKGKIKDASSLDTTTIGLTSLSYEKRKEEKSFLSFFILYIDILFFILIQFKKKKRPIRNFLKKRGRSRYGSNFAADMLQQTRSDGRVR